MNCVIFMYFAHRCIICIHNEHFTVLISPSVLRTFVWKAHNLIGSFIIKVHFVKMCKLYWYLTKCTSIHLESRCTASVLCIMLMYFAYSLINFLYIDCNILG